MCMYSGIKQKQPKNSPSPAGRSPQRGRVGVGVAILSINRNFAFSIICYPHPSPLPQGEGVYRRFYLLPFTQENRFSQTINRLSKKRIQHVVEQGEAAFGRFQSLLNGGLKQSLRDEAVERRAHIVQRQRATLC